MGTIVQFPSKLRPSVPTADEAGAGRPPVLRSPPQRPSLGARLIDQGWRPPGYPGVGTGVGIGLGIGAAAGAAAVDFAKREATSDDSERNDPHGPSELPASAAADHGKP